MASGGVYEHGTALAALNFATPYLRAVLGFMGITDVNFIAAEGTSKLMSGDVDRKPSSRRRSRKCMYRPVCKTQIHAQETQMKIAATIARYLLGLIFLVFGLNGFLHFIPMPPPRALRRSSSEVRSLCRTFGWSSSAFRFLGGVLLLVNRFVWLAVVLLGPVIVNILCFHALMAPEGLPLAIVVAVLWVILAVRYKQYLAGIFVQNAA